MLSHSREWQPHTLHAHFLEAGAGQLTARKLPAVSSGVLFVTGNKGRLIYLEGSVGAVPAASCHGAAEEPPLRTTPLSLPPQGKQVLELSERPGSSKFSVQPRHN